jgi:hypothetical protein
MTNKSRMSVFYVTIQTIWSLYIKKSFKMYAQKDEPVVGIFWWRPLITFVQRVRRIGNTRGGVAAYRIVNPIIITSTFLILPSLLTIFKKTYTSPTAVGGRCSQSVYIYIYFFLFWFPFLSSYSPRDGAIASIWCSPLRKLLR